jgi:hypothetical protein
MFIYWHARLDLCLCRLDGGFGHLLCGAATLTKTREDGGHLLGLDV